MLTWEEGGWNKEGIMSFKYFVAGFVENQGTHTPRNIEVAINTPPHVNDGAGRALHSFRDIKEVEKMIGENG